MISDNDPSRYEPEDNTVSATDPLTDDYSDSEYECTDHHDRAECNDYSTIKHEPTILKIEW